VCRRPLRFVADSPLEGDGFELPVPRQIGNAFTGAAPSSGASRAKAAQPCSAASARIGATVPQRQAARIVIRHPFNPAPYPQHHRRLALSNGLAHDQNPAAAVGTRIATSASVRAEKRAVDRRILVDVCENRRSPDRGGSGRRCAFRGRVSSMPSGISLTPAPCYASMSQAKRRHSPPPAYGLVQNMWSPE
jgi:hypothetical protein